DPNPNVKRRRLLVSYSWVQRAPILPWYLLAGVSLSSIVAAYQGKGAASYAASLSNLAHPGTNDLTAGVAPTWSTGVGWTFNGTTQYLKTNIFSPQATWSVFAQYTGLSNGWVVGANDGSEYGVIASSVAGGMAAGLGPDANGYTPPVLAAGNY